MGGRNVQQERIRSLATRLTYSLFSLNALLMEIFAYRHNVYVLNDVFDKQQMIALMRILIFGPLIFAIHVVFALCVQIIKVFLRYHHIWFFFIVFCYCRNLCSTY